MVHPIVGMSLQGGNMGNMGKPMELRECKVLQRLAILHLGMPVGSIIACDDDDDHMITVIFDTGPRYADFVSVRLCQGGWINGEREVLTEDVDLVPLLDRDWDMHVVPAIQAACA